MKHVLAFEKAAVAIRETLSKGGDTWDAYEAAKKHLRAEVWDGDDWKKIVSVLSIVAEIGCDEMRAETEDDQC